MKEHNEQSDILVEKLVIVVENCQDWHHYCKHTMNIYQEIMRTWLL